MTINYSDTKAQRHRCTRGQRFESSALAPLRLCSAPMLTFICLIFLVLPFGFQDFSPARNAEAFKLSGFKWCGVSSEDFYYGFLNKKDFKTVARNSINFWNRTLGEKTLTDFRFVPQAGKKGKASGDGINGMYWDKDLGYATLGVTSTLYYPHSTSGCDSNLGKIEETDIAFNSGSGFAITFTQASKNPDKTYFWFVVVHELGHALGIDHSSNSKAIMAPYYHLQNKLGADDIKAIQKLYGARN